MNVALKNTPCLIVMLLVASGLCASPTVGQTLFDDFNDNICNTAMWEYGTDEDGDLAEIHEHLEYTSPGELEPDEENAAYYKLKTPAPYGTGWTVTLDVHVGDYGGGPESDHDYGMEVVVLNTADYRDGLWFGLDRGWWEDEYYLGWWIEKTTDEGEEMEEHYAPATASDGALKLVWDGTSFHSYYNEGAGFQALGSSISVGDWDMDGSSTFTLRIGGWDWGCDFALDDGSKLYCDNFELVIPEPATLSLLGLGALAFGLRSRRAALIRRRN